METLSVRRGSEAAGRSLTEMNALCAGARVAAVIRGGQVRYDLFLKPEHAWGYKLRYEGSTLVVSLRQPPVLPAFGSPLSGRKVVLDPGHGGDEDMGTTGPTGLHEKDLTLPVARLVRDEVRRAGG